MSRSVVHHRLTSVRVRIVALCVLAALAFTLLPAATSQARPSDQAAPALSVGTWNTMLHPWFPYQADVVKEIGKTNFDVLALQEVWTDAAKDAIVSDPTVKAKYPYSYYAPPDQQFAYCSLDLPRGKLEDLLSSIIVGGTDPRTFVHPNKPYDQLTDYLVLGIAFREQTLCLQGIFSTVQGYPDDKSPYDVIDECYFQGCVKYSHGGSPGLLILSKQPINNVQSIPYDTYQEKRTIVYATIADTRFAFTQFPFNYFRDIDQEFAYFQIGVQQPQMAQDIINAQPDYIVGDFNSGPNYQPEAYNLLLTNGYHALTTQDTYCPAATHTSFGPCERTVGNVHSRAIDNIFVKTVPACFTPGTFARTPISDHIGLSICNTAPVAQVDTYSVNQGATLTVAAPGVLQNDTDTDAQHDTLTAVKLTDPAHGSVTLNADGSFTYTPVTSYAGTDSFTYQASDGIATSSAATVTITVSAAPTNTATATQTATRTNTPTNTATASATSTSLPSATASTTATHSPTASGTATATRTRTPTQTSSPTKTPTRTATAAPAQSTVVASADSYVQQKDATKNFGTKSSLIVDGTDDPREVYLRFTVNAAGTIRKAVLRLYVTDGSKDGPRLYQAATSTWSENALTWNNRPGATGPVLGNLGTLNDKVWIEYDVTSSVKSNGTYSFVLVGDSTDSVAFASREGTNKPQLVLTTQP